MNNKQRDYYKKRTTDAVLNDALSNRGKLKQESIDSFNRKPYYMQNATRNAHANASFTE